MILKKTNIIVIFSFLYAPLAFSGVYKWIDEHHQTHYSNKPEGKAERIKTSKSTDVITQEQNELESLKAKLKQYDDEKANALQEAEKQKNIATLNQYNCKVAQQKLISLQPARVKQTTASGFKYLNDEQKQAEIAQAKLEISQFCIEKQ